MVRIQEPSLLFHPDRTQDSDTHPLPVSCILVPSAEHCSIPYSIQFESLQYFQMDFVNGYRPSFENLKNAIILGSAATIWSNFRAFARIRTASGSSCR